MSDEIAENPVYSLPPFIAQEVSVALSQTVDWSLAVNKIPELHLAGFTGRGVPVAILDTGVSLNHPDLQGAIAGHRDFTGEGIEDNVGHGTHTAGTVAARANDIGVLGVAPQSSLFIGKCLTRSGGSDQWIGAAIRWAVDQGARLINLSLGSPQPGRMMQDAIAYAVSRNVLVICAAGNDGRANSVNYPAKYPTVCAVSAYDEQGNLAPFSSRGPEVDIAGPGVNILSTYKNAGYAKLSGSSMSSPFCVGVAALLLEKHPEINRIDDLISRFRRGAIDPGPGSDFGWVLRNPHDVLVDPVVPPPAPPPPIDPPPPSKPPAIEIEIGLGLVFHVPAQPTDLATGGIAFKAGGTLDASVDAVKLLRQLEQAAALSHAIQED